MSVNNHFGLCHVICALYDTDKDVVIYADGKKLTNKALTVTVEEALQLSLQECYYNARLFGLSKDSLKHAAEYLRDNHITAVAYSDYIYYTKEDIANMELQHLYDIELLK